MSITSEITRLSNAKTSLKTAINNKLGTSTKIANEKIDQYATFVNNITTGTGADINDYFITEFSSSQLNANKLIKKLPKVTVSSNCTSLEDAFSGFVSLETLDLSNFNTSNVTNMRSMFNDCESLTTLDLSNFNTSNVTNMRSMFNDCESLTTLDLSNFNTSNVTNMSSMFYGCLYLNTLNITGWNFQNVNYIAQILMNCSNLTTIVGTFQNLGQAYSTTASSNYSYYTLNLSSCTKLTEQSLINVLDGLYDIASKGCNPQKVVLGATNLAKLTSTEGQNALAQAQSYGWTVS